MSPCHSAGQTAFSADQRMANTENIGAQFDAESGAFAAETPDSNRYVHCGLNLFHPLVGARPRQAIGVYKSFLSITLLVLPESIFAKA
jgi:hypothetical protein